MPDPSPHAPSASRAHLASLVWSLLTGLPWLLAVVVLAVLFGSPTGWEERQGGPMGDLNVELLLVFWALLIVALGPIVGVAVGLWRRRLWASICAGLCAFVVGYLSLPWGPLGNLVPLVLTGALLVRHGRRGALARRDLPA